MFVSLVKFKGAKVAMNVIKVCVELIPKVTLANVVFDKFDETAEDKIFAKIL